jgi:acyl carrier protein
VEATTSRKQNPSIEEIEDWLVAKIAESLDIACDQIDISEPFARYGLNSTDALILTGELEVWLGHELNSTLVWDYPTIEAVAHYIVDEITRAQGVADTPLE